MKKLRIGYVAGLVFALAGVPVAVRQLSIALAREELKQESVAQLSYTRDLMLAFHLFALENEGRFPTNIAQGLPFLREGLKTQNNVSPENAGKRKFGLNPEDYEIVFSGPKPNMPKPWKLIVIREKEARPHPDGGKLRVYAFADGHSEIYRAADGNFEAWEAERIIKPAE